MDIPRDKPVVTSVDARGLPEREGDLLDGYRRMLAAGQPDGLVRSELLRGQDGSWRIQSTWWDMEALLALRKAGVPHAAQALLDGVGAEHTHSWFVVEDGFDTT
ncbi:hypothetical protein E3T26_02865 [Cryobacterium sp. TMT1-21]|uniref:ABM domain-containing protein n=1 Tax=Cryobacterium shii TaxID=1259235 RepID=A0AAQ2C7W8_9MICO|nr:MULTISPECIES: hypothetical protein [Cryobacterium]TFC51218.1 hypothetical protein E3O49_03840 [Cryobacterium shii]TFC80478.1 hypothetical protein E3T24_16875 [Cryobacterium sp. TmT2-59]TFD17046.1 hypothetical protein E3T26_02865 [Cryobacterium sp. TMT1-21]TFD17510.1 hypothetical protein E3T42_07650 [Cryobacterium sp. TMT4-10]TFD18209.1 hypothetical protein E3T32_12815 [Cryobacterium sp. TMT2-23]